MEKKKDYRLKYKIELYKNGRRVQSTFSAKKTKIVLSSRVIKYKSGVLKVMLGNCRNVVNVAIFTNTEELEKAISILTEKRLIDYIGGENGESV